MLNADVMKHSLRLLRAALRGFGSVDASMPLFHSKRGARISYDTLYYQWLRLFEVVPFRYPERSLLC